MAYPLSSPGVDIEVTDEAFYAASGQGTVPLFILGTHEYKTQPNSTTVAAGTLPENANNLYLITSQRELIQTFGNPIFYTSQGTPLDGYELNEYGLHAAYQYLALSSTAYVIRGALDYSQLRPSSSHPVGPPVGGTYWLNTTTSSWGIQQYDGTNWINQKPLVIDQDTDLVFTLVGTGVGSDDPTTAQITADGELVINTTHTASLTAGMTLNDAVSAINAATGATSAWVVGVAGKAYIMLIDALDEGKLDLAGTTNQILVDLGLSDGNTDQAAQLQPKSSVGSDGDYCVNAVFNDNQIFQKLTSFYMVGSTETASPTTWCLVNSDMWEKSTKATVNGTANKVTYGPHYTLPVNPRTGDVWIVTTPFNNGADFVLQAYNANTGAWVSVSAPVYADDAAANAGIGTNFLTVNSSVYLQCPGTVDTANNKATAGFTPMILTAINPDNSTVWSVLEYQAQSTAPTTEPADGTLWFNNDFKVDIMVSTGQKWQGYRTAFPQTDPNGPILDASAPTTQSDNTALVDNDIWIDTSLASLESYPKIYRYKANTKTWTLIDNNDDTTPKGIIFADARWNIDGSKDGDQNIASLVTSDYVDPDAPDALLYPTGLLLFNTRYSTQNVKQWQSTQLSGLYQSTDYTSVDYTVGTQSFDPVPYGGRWVTISGNNGNAPYAGRKAQREVIVKSLKAVVNSNDALLAETFYFNLMCAPGYPELIEDMDNLNTAKKQVAFIVADTPPRLDPSGTSLANWAKNTAAAKDNGEDGLVTASQFVGIYYPWALTTNIDGTTIIVPPSTVAMRTIAYSDSVSYPWYTPAGYTRGLVNNASSVGYIDRTTGLFKAVLLNQGQRDVLYQNNINAIAYMPNRGLVIMGDKTLSPLANAENRINVARLVNYLRYNLNNIAQPFIFEPNVQHTQDSAKTVMERFLSNLVTLNALYDFIVVCDSSNNTPDRIDNNELWIDIAIQPVKTIDFIYIPLRLEPTGTDLASLYSGSAGAVK